MYGGGFATVPAYLADIFGTQMVGAIHGRLLTAWSAAGIIGPVLINYIRDFQLAHGVSKALAYDITMYILVGLLVLGFICNWLVKPVDEKHYMTEAELAAELKKAHESDAVAQVSGAGTGGWGFANPDRSLVVRRHPDPVGRMDHTAEGVSCCSIDAVRPGIA
jgi:MFS family permease